MIHWGQDCSKRGNLRKNLLRSSKQKTVIHWPLKIWKTTGKSTTETTQNARGSMMHWGKTDLNAEIYGKTCCGQANRKRWYIGHWKFERLRANLRPKPRKEHTARWFIGGKTDLNAAIYGKTCCGQANRKRWYIGHWKFERLRAKLCGQADGRMVIESSDWLVWNLRANLRRKPRETYEAGWCIWAEMNQLHAEN